MKGLNKTWIKPAKTLAGVIITLGALYQISAETLGWWHIKQPTALILHQGIWCILGIVVFYALWRALDIYNVALLRQEWWIVHGSTILFGLLNATGWVVMNYVINYNLWSTTLLTKSFCYGVGFGLIRIVVLRYRIHKAIQSKK
jgi:hypothetical protein